MGIRKSYLNFQTKDEEKDYLTPITKDTIIRKINRNKAYFENDGNYNLLGLF